MPFQKGYTPWNKYTKDIPRDHRFVYLMGAILGDGNVSISSGEVRLSGERGFVEKVAGVASILLCKKKPSVKKIKCETFLTRICCKKLAEKFLYLSHEDKKILIKKYPRNFLSGIYEADGTLIEDKRKRNSYSLRISNTDPEIVELICQALNTFDFDHGIIEDDSKVEEGRKLCYHIYLKGGLREIARFLNLTKPVIKTHKDFIPEYKCQECGKRFEKPHQLSGHYRAAHFMSEDERRKFSKLALEARWG